MLGADANSACVYGCFGTSASASIVCVALACLNVAIFANHLQRRAEEDDPVRRAMVFAEPEGSCR